MADMDKQEPAQETQEVSPVTQKTWSEFRQTGLMTMINTFLHIFGWAIVVQINDDGSEIVYPARTVFRGFSEQSQAASYNKITTYMKTNIDELVKESAIDESNV